MPELSRKKQIAPEAKARFMFSGDMPHNLATVRVFLRQVRYMLVIKHGNRTAFVRGSIPARWMRSGMATRMKGVLTEFGPVSFVLEGYDEQTEDRSSSEVGRAQAVSSSEGNPLRVDGWSGDFGRRLSFRQKAMSTSNLSRNG